MSTKLKSLEIQSSYKLIVRYDSTVTDMLGNYVVNEVEEVTGLEPDIDHGDFMEWTMEWETSDDKIGRKMLKLCDTIGPDFFEGLTIPPFWYDVLIEKSKFKI